VARSLEGGFVGAEGGRVGGGWTGALRVVKVGRGGGVGGRAEMVSLWVLWGEGA